MAKPRNKLIDLIQYFFIRLFAAGLQIFPPEDNYRATRFLARLVWRLDRYHRRIACGHLRLSFPDWPEERVQHVARESFCSLAYLGIEMLLTPRLITPARWPRHIRFHNLGGILREMIRNDSGLILVSGHFGNWEVVGYTMATLGFPTVSVARALDNPYADEFILGVRERTGQHILGKKGATPGMSDVLERGEVLGFMADQDAGQRGLYVDFFGRPASTFKSIALLAERFGVPVVVGYGRRLSLKYEFELGVQRVIRPAEWAGRPDPTRWITQEFTAALEALARQWPEQYMWVHRRWKHRPDKTKAGGIGVA